MGAGFHGIGGVTNACLKKMLEAYVLPRLLYALESLVIKDKQKEMLDVFLRDLLKRIQALPTRTANEAPYLLMGCLPAEAMLDINTLNFFGRIITDPSSILYQVCCRQLATKSLSSNSWFIAVTKLAYKYGLPSPHILILAPMKVSSWKKLVKKKVTAFWMDKMENAAAEKSTLLRISQERPTWQHVELNHQAVARGRLQARLLTDTITLQKHRAKFYSEDPSCKLCHQEEEDVAHVLARCPALNHTRHTLLQPIFRRMIEIGDPPPRSEEEIIQILLGFSSDPAIYNLGSTACFAIIHLRHSLYLYPHR